ncbi:MAG: Asp-tRNA(Asn)/Glu-tRNA(Gln) amidotransferase subunit GatC [Opitutales bacterium]
MPETGNIDIDYVARLARIALTDEEKVRYAAQLGDVLAHFERLQAIDVSGVEPTAHTFPVVNVWQEDEPTQPFAPEEALRNAPRQRDNQIVVPKVIEDA